MGCLSTSFHHNFLSTSKTSKYLKTLTSAVEDLDNNCKSALKNLWFSETERNKNKYNDLSPVDGNRHKKVNILTEIVIDARRKFPAGNMIFWCR